ncbi:hypothetical protein FOZ63_000640 [Perkinsus olseni]|uniref:Uncharacterized protein n=1 Tax=Perkinsus olseni TaxID=32597 RepID=A0A7J6UPU6_PEROL|nr:hypothetical protein FOZ63_000640 [Perkinsus olseni]
MNHLIATALVDNTEMTLVSHALPSDLYGKRQSYGPLADHHCQYVTAEALQTFSLRTDGQVERQLQESCGQDCVTAWSDKMLPMLEKFQAKEKGQHGANDVIPLAVFDMIADLNGKLKTARQAILRDVASFARSGDPATHSLSLAVTDMDIQGESLGNVYP